MYKDTWETIIGTSDTFLYLGGMEQSTHEYISKLLGKETIEQRNISVTKGANGSYNESFQKLGRNLMEPDEVASLKGQECILKIRGVHPFLSKKYNIEKHKNYKRLGDVNKEYWYSREEEPETTGLESIEGKDFDLSQLQDLPEEELARLNEELNVEEFEALLEEEFEAVETEENNSAERNE